MRSELWKSCLPLCLAAATACGGVSDIGTPPARQVGESTRPVSTEADKVITLIIDPDPSLNRIDYSPDNRVSPGQTVVFKVQGSTEVYTVSFPDGSCLTNSSLTFGGATFAQQTSEVQTVASVSPGSYGFVIDPSTVGALDTSRRALETKQGELDVTTDPP